MLPNIHADNGAVRQERVLVDRRHDLELPSLGVKSLHVVVTINASHDGEKDASTYNPAPTGTLDGSRGRVEFLDQLVERAKVGHDGGLQRPVLDHATKNPLALCCGRR